MTQHCSQWTQRYKMAIEVLGLGSAANDHAGDSLRIAGRKINDNFAEIYNEFGNGTTLALAAVAKSGLYSDISGTPPTPPELAFVPTTSTSAGTFGQIAIDANYLYLCIGNSLWKRVALTIW